MHNTMIQSRFYGEMTASSSHGIGILGHPYADTLTLTKTLYLRHKLAQSILDA